MSLLTHEWRNQIVVRKKNKYGPYFESKQLFQGVDESWLHPHVDASGKKKMKTKTFIVCILNESSKSTHMAAAVVTPYIK